MAPAGHGSVSNGEGRNASAAAGRQPSGAEVPRSADHVRHPRVSDARRRTIAEAVVLKHLDPRRLRAAGRERPVQGAAQVGRSRVVPRERTVGEDAQPSGSVAQTTLQGGEAGGDAGLAGLGPRAGLERSGLALCRTWRRTEGAITSVVVRRERGNPRRATTRRRAGNGAEPTRTPRRSKASKSRPHPRKGGERQGGNGVR